MGPASWFTVDSEQFTVGNRCYFWILASGRKTENGKRRTENDRSLSADPLRTYVLTPGTSPVSATQQHGTPVRPSTSQR